MVKNRNFVNRILANITILDKTEIWVKKLTRNFLRKFKRYRDWYPENITIPKFLENDIFYELCGKFELQVNLILTEISIFAQILSIA